MVQAMLGNAAVAAVLALLALAVGYAVRSPAVRHAAWVIVLLKLITPPLFVVPLAVLPASWGAAPVPPSRGDFIVLSPTSSDTNSASARAVARVPASWGSYLPTTMAEWAIVVWVAGAAGWFACQGRRMVRFRSRVLAAEDAPPEVAAAAGRIGETLGIARPPAVKLATGIGSPVLWGWGRGAVVLFPRDLLARLAPEARDTLLAHELAHYLRRDHWVRILEFIVTGLYWWHPAVWLARAGIEAAEEECCDAWVVGGLAASPRSYAEALLATVDYEAELRRPCLPPGACAANRSARLLRRRLFGIIHAGRPRRLRGGVVLWILVFGTLVTQPVLRARVAGAEGGGRESTAGNESLSPVTPPPTPPPWAASGAPLKAKEPRSWATAEAPGGGLAVVARDNEVVLRGADGTSRTLGPGRPLALAFAPGGRRLTTAGPGPLVRTWDDRGELLLTAHAPAAARAVAYTPDGSAVLVLDAASGITVYDPQTLAALASWSVEGPANSIACSPDSLTIVVSFGSWLAESGWVECWSIAGRRKLATYRASAPVGAARFTPDGRMLIVGGWNGVTAWRSLPGGELIAERQLPKQLVATAAFSPDAGTLPLVPPPEPAPPPSPVLIPAPDWVQGTEPFPER